MTTRREILTAGLVLPSLLQRGRRKHRRPLPPKVNGGINVQPLRRMDAVSDFSPPLIVPDLVLEQMRVVYELGFRKMRVTLSFSRFGPDFFGAIPYVRVARALGIDVLGIIDQFGTGFDLMRRLTDDARRRSALEAYAKIFGQSVPRASPRVRRGGELAFQILNEPSESRGLPPAFYVTRILAPTYADFASIAPEIEILSAGTAGRFGGLLRLRQMLLAGLERVCDRVAVHVYDPEMIDELRGLIRAPVSVTETAARATADHLGWVERMYPRLRDALPAELDEIYWFDLFDFEPGVFRLIDLVPDQITGVVRARVESPELYGYWRDRVREASGDKPRATFDELVPSLEPYLPTSRDFAIADAAR